MVKEEIWSIPLERVRAFFLAQPDVAAEAADRFRYESCRISVEPLSPALEGMWAAKRTRLRLEGREEDVARIYHRFFLQFLSAGG